MAQRDDTTKRVPRRELLKGAVIGAAGVAAVGALGGSAAAASGTATPTPKDTCPPCVPWPVEVPETWDRETDVLVLGGGGGGLSAAIEAFDAGVEVLVLEKSAMLRGSTAICGGGVAGAVTKLQEEAGIEDDPELFTADWLKSGSEMNDPEIVRAIAYLSGETVDWLVEEGVQLSYTPQATFPHSVARTYSALPLGNGLGFMTGLQAAAERRGIEVLFETAGTKLYRDVEGKVVGAEATDKKGKTLAIEARRGVVLATGGIAGNLEAVRKYIPAIADVMKTAKTFVSMAWPYDTGDGIEMARAIGATEVTYAAFYANQNIETSPGRGSMLYTPASAGDGFIAVGATGERFMDETSAEANSSTKPYLKLPGKVFYVILDENLKSTERIKTYITDFLIEPMLEAEYPSVQKADTIEELAEKLEIPPEALAKTIEQWNSYVEAGEDPDFGRTELGPGIKEPPFYSLEVCPGIAMSKGGLRINPKGQVLDNDWVVIPRLYAAGDDASGQAQGSALYHVAGGGVGIAMNFGRIGGRNAAAEEPWE